MTQDKEKENKFSFINPGDSKIAPIKRDERSQGKKKGNCHLPRSHSHQVYHPARLKNQKTK